MKKEFELRWQSADNLDALINDSYSALKDKVEIALNKDIIIFIMGKQIIIPYKNIDGQSWSKDELEQIFIDAFEASDDIYCVPIS